MDVRKVIANIGLLAKVKALNPGTMPAGTLVDLGVENDRFEIPEGALVRVGEITLAAEAVDLDIDMETFAPILTTGTPTYKGLGTTDFEGNAAGSFDKVHALLFIFTSSSDSNSGLNVSNTSHFLFATNPDDGAIARQLSYFPEGIDASASNTIAIDAPVAAAGILQVVAIGSAA